MNILLKYNKNGKQLYIKKKKPIFFVWKCVLFMLAMAYTFHMLMSNSIFEFEILVFF